MLLNKLDMSKITDVQKTPLILLTLQSMACTLCVILRKLIVSYTALYIDGLVQDRHNYSALAMELHLSCTNPSILLSVLKFYYIQPISNWL